MGLAGPWVGVGEGQGVGLWGLGPRLGEGDPTEAASVDVDPEYTRPHAPCRGHVVGPVGGGARTGLGGAMIFPFPA